MPSVAQNRSAWDGVYDWDGDGDEWSAAWGGVASQWHATLWPRVEPFLPTGTVLEIAPGYGRWTQFLLPLCERYVGIDLAEGAIEACRTRFSSTPHATFHVTDGRSVPGVGAGEVDLAFSFDSLVHVEADVIAAYLGELARVLAPDGVAFIHHSNLGEYRGVLRRHALAARARRQRATEPAWTHWRGRSVTADVFAGAAEAAGLACIGQEVINWLGGRMIDCFSMVTPLGSTFERPRVVVRNPLFSAEALSASAAAAAFRPGVTRSPPATVTPLATSPSVAIGGTVGPLAVSLVGPRFRHPSREP